VKWTAWGAALALGLSAAGASALTLGGTGTVVDPVYFNSGGNFGLITGPAFDFAATSSGDWRAVGSGGALSIQTALQTPVLQNPQSPASSLNPLGPQGTPTTSNPFVADSIWTVTNTTNTELKNAYLFFDAVNLAPTSLLPGKYPNIPVGIDRNLYSIVKYTSPGATSPLFFAALSLGSLAPDGSPGDSTQVHVRYIVAGALPQIGANLVMPPFSVAALINVPEPGTLVLVGSGVVLLGATRRRRCA
jgi:hypothetical protein